MGKRQQRRFSGRGSSPALDRVPDMDGPGTTVRILHGKPWGRDVTMVGTVVGWTDSVLTLARTFKPGGRYDSLWAPKLAGDHGTIDVIPGGWVLRRAYRRADDTLIGELFNVQTPTVVEPGWVRYTDLEIDVARFPDGRVEVVDEADLERVARDGGISAELAEKARSIAYRLADILRAGGDWREADATFRTGDQPPR